MTTALVVIDLQNDVLDGCVRVDPVLAATRTLLAGARAAGVPVVWVQHQGPGLERDTDGWRIHPALDPSPGEPVVAKSYRDAFADTTLRATLGDADHLVLCGAQTDYCVRTTAQRAAAGRIPACRTRNRARPSQEYSAALRSRRADLRATPRVRDTGAEKLHPVSVRG